MFPQRKGTRFLSTLALAGSLIVQACTKTHHAYVCQSPNTTRYHLKRDCAGLNSCTYHVVQTDIDKAEKDGKTLCRFERTE